ncbi:MAG: bifunctional serine/threonine-protein kinase/formylglycine-generating enzyme family protein [Myxococcota bacterium]
MQDFPDLPFEQRYEILQQLGMGGMAVVYRARDRVLGREVALKQSTDLQDRFANEILLTARLDHPNIVTVLDAGLLNGALTFAMPIVEGVTLRHLMRARFAGKPVYGRPVTLHRVIDALRIACGAVGFAHGRDVVHRDLKPDNVMVGPHGEVVVLDWGIAKVLGEDEPEVERMNAGLTDIVRAQALTDGILGTPGYVAPENFADGDHDPRSDVFALGSVLYNALTGRSAFRGKSTFEILMALKKRRRRAIRGTMHIPRGLAAVCRRALAWEPSERYASASDMARDLEEWLEGNKQREVAWAKADQLVAEAQVLLEQTSQARKRASSLRQDAALRRETLAPHSPLSEKEGVWALQDHAEAADMAGDLAEQHALDLLLGAKVHVPEHTQVAELLTQTLRDSHLRLEAAGRMREAARVGHTLRFHDDAGRYTAYLEGEGTLSLRTEPAASATLVPLEEVGRRLVPGKPVPLGPTPIEPRSLAFGAYVVELVSPGLPVIPVPVLIRRRGLWPPLQAEHTEAVRLPAPGSLGADECFVPAGHYASRRTRERWHWCDAFVIARDPVTWDAYGRFLEVAPEWAPDTAPGRPDTPVHSVPIAAARAYAAWVSELDGHAWRLPTEPEWEKAAGGVDGRRFVWGAHADPAWGRFRDSLPDGPRVASVTAETLDVSVYGVRGMAGNLADWCEGPGDVARGGSWLDDARRSEIAVRRVLRKGQCAETVGFRLVRTP